MKNLYLFSVVCSLFGAGVFAQTPADVKKIVANYDMAKLKEKENYYRKRAEIEKQKAEAAARINNWPIFIKNEDGSFGELMKLSSDGYPLYYMTTNVAAARTTRTNFLHNGGGMGLNLEGQNMTVREWDGGNVRASHNAFGGRVTVVDDNSPTYVAHSTHVCGTMISSTAAIKGMAPQALARTFNWTNDESEALSEVQLGMLVSNHSYGVPIGSGASVLPSWIVGAYVSDSASWDEIAYLSPYYLQVASAGNEGDSNENTDPLAPGFDKLTTNKTSKNNLVVANCADATVNPTTGAVTGTLNINSSSSQGPADDLRIKPDITGNGTGLLSANSTSNTATTTMSGTSMSSPNVAGTLILLQQHYKNLSNSFMRSATLKGLACHTADDFGPIGPDPTWGWGLLNAKKAVETLTANGLTSWVSEETLKQGESFTMTVNSLGTTPLIASATWTDLPGQTNINGVINDPTRAIVNDLDIRITRNTPAATYFPWKLLAADAPAVRNADNNVDNVEQVKIDAPTAGNYTITVTHKGTLVTGSQKYSLVITGINSAFAINSTSDNLTLCSNQTAVYNFNYTQTGAGTTNFTATGLPAGANVVFSPASLNANGVVTMTVSNLGAVAPGEYSVGIVGNNGSEAETRYKLLQVYNATFQNVVQTTPTNGQNGLSTATILKWAAQANAETYNIQVSASASFGTLLVDQTVTTTQYTVTALNQDTTYYWRVTPSNRCGNGNAASATVFSFHTGILVCDQNFTATDYSNGVIGSVANSTASVPLQITGGHSIGDMKVKINLTHTYVQDMTITLQGPASIGSPVVVLLQEPCTSQDDINCTITDTGGAPACSGTPAISGLIAPFEPLNVLNSLPADGTWTLHVNDPYDGDGGIINEFAINMCRVTAGLGIDENTSLSDASIYPNPTKGIVNISLPNLTEKTTIDLYDLQGRKILSQQTEQIHSSINIDNLQDGVYMVSLQNASGSTTKKIVLRR